MTRRKQLLILAGSLTLMLILGLFLGWTLRGGLPGPKPETAIVGAWGEETLPLQAWEDLSDRPGSPESVVRSFFGALSYGGSAPHFGTIGRGDELPYRKAYGYLSKVERQRIPYPKFEEGFTGIAVLDLLNLFVVPESDTGERAQLYVELKTLEEVPISAEAQAFFEFSGPEVKDGFLYTMALVDVVREGESWRIERIQLIPEDFISAGGGHQAWAWSPEFYGLALAQRKLDEGISAGAEPKLEGIETVRRGLIEVSSSFADREVKVWFARPRAGRLLPLKVVVEQR